MTEAKLYQLLKTLLAAKWRPWRIETDTSLGVSDVFYQTDNDCGWLELKQGELAADKDTVRLGQHLTVAQADFLRCVNCTMTANLLIGVHHRSAWHSIIIIPGHDAWLSFANTKTASLSELKAGPRWITVLDRPYFHRVAEFL